jgi:hypothetical protein
MAGVWQGAQRRELAVPGSLDRPGQADAPDQPDAPDRTERLRSASQRPHASPEPDFPDQGRPVDHLPPGDQPARWSRADLRHRLELLPPGHPSSPPGEDLDHGQPPDAQGPDLATPSETTGQEDGRRHEAQPDRQAEAVKRDFWTEAPAFLRAATDLDRRWPADQAAAAIDRSRDPAGSWRGDGNQYLNPSQHAEARDVIAEVQCRSSAPARRISPSS